MNGSVVLVLGSSPWRLKCRRLGNRLVNHYAVEFPGQGRAWALPDELFFDPVDHTSSEHDWECCQTCVDQAVNDELLSYGAQALET